MKKIILALALACFAGAGMATPALACEGGTCKMEHKDDKASKKKKKKAPAATAECHMPAAAATNTSATGEAKSCCMNKQAPKAETVKDVKAN